MNVVYIKDHFPGSTVQDIIKFVSDHNLIYLDLEIERKEDNPLIEKICEINCCSTDREYTRNCIPSKGVKRKSKEADTESEISNLSLCGDKKVAVEKQKEWCNERKSNEPLANDSKLARPIPDDVSSIASNETSGKFRTNQRTPADIVRREQKKIIKFGIKQKNPILMIWEVHLSFNIGLVHFFLVVST